ncbi:hypothetical protein FPQ18DRAFT_274878 [Pyronema domesticum]|uniref:Uncharacterized protein n=1 Tax=Pyronema omphalodes (strain CBS 100304) TaxID=1076935 RepID=U4KTZ5_PYROM|nr:hypothetical protein FPQ18DRAFT_274878 [Pyronema domesticum]CCX04598.1 Similar to hypothetical protein [Tuber melanosporum Mel28]; acc. no. XP_002840498 [Pyronema omphalodes CBS 100304]
MAALRTRPATLLRLNPLLRFTQTRRCISTLPEQPDIYVHPAPNGGHTLSLISTPSERVALGTTTSLPPKPDTFTENPSFLPILHKLLAKHAASDPLVQSDALQFASPAGMGLFGKNTRRPKKDKKTDEANNRGAAGGGGVGGWVHVYDQRGVPAFGRIAETEDIFGSLLVGPDGMIKAGEWEENRMYRLITSTGGLMRLSPYLAEKVKEDLEAEAKR